MVVSIELTAEGSDDGPINLEWKPTAGVRLVWYELE